MSELREPTPAVPAEPPKKLWKLPPWTWQAAMVGAFGFLIGSQIVAPNQRILQVVAAGVIVVSALRVRSYIGLLILIPLLPYPKATTYGGTHLAFLFFIFLIWLARLHFRAEKTVGKSPIDLPVLLLVLAYLLSFSQLAEYSLLLEASINFFHALIYIALAYMTYHLIQDEGGLRRIVAAVVVMATSILLAAVFELNFPHRALIPGWIELGAGARLVYLEEGLEITNLRVGGPFGDYELLAEFCAMMVPLFWFLFARARTWATRLGSLFLLGLNFFVLFATVTRGALISLAVAVGLLLWTARRHIRFPTFVLYSTAALFLAWGLLTFVATNTRSGNVWDRLMHTEFKGLTPDSRVGAWSGAWERILESPILGHGPYFTHRVGVREFSWPHNNYFFYWHIVGAVGLAAFLFLLYRLFWATRFRATSLAHPSYARGLLLALQVMLVLFLVDQIKIDYIRNKIYPFWVWLFFGILLATSRLAKLDMSGTSPAIDREEKPSPKTRRLASVAPLPAVSPRPR